MSSLTIGSVLALLFVFAAHLQLATCSPALLWSSHIDGTKDMVDYRTLSPRELAKSVMSEGGWSDYLCSEKEAHQSQSFAFLFIGTELQSAADIARPTNAGQSLVGLLKDSFSNSNHSLAFPYVAGQEENMAIESSLISEFVNTCQHSPVISNVAVIGSCLVDGEHFDNLEDYQSVHDYMHSRMEKNPHGHTDLIVLCRVGSHLKGDSDQSHSEVGVISQLLSSVKQLGAKYSFLYVSDPSSRRPLERFLAEGSIGNGTVNSTACDGVCQIKSSLLEGLFVGIVLLVILISGLCCMAGIDTPTRFETPQDS